MCTSALNVPALKARVSALLSGLFLNEYLDAAAIEDDFIESVFGATAVDVREGMRKN